MPVRSLNSAVLKWPDAETVIAAAREWAARTAAARKDVARIYCFGSVVTGNWGPGSDLDIIVEVRRPGGDFISRGAAFDTAGLPVPADVLVYTTSELSSLREEAGRFIREFDRGHALLWE